MAEENNNLKNNNAAEPDMKQLLKVRREKLRQLQDENADPFEITKYDRTHTSKDICDGYTTEERDVTTREGEKHVTAKISPLDGQVVRIAGRLMSKRGMGKVSFGHVADIGGQIQIFVKKDILGEDDYNRFKKLDIGDIIGVEGEVFTTQTGEISIRASRVTLLSKSLLPLPEKFHGLSDPDLRYRQRYLDLIMNADVKETFIRRSKIVSAIRNYLDSRGYLEVETPILNTIAGGAAARPFITHHNTLDMDMYLRIATELNLKRLIVGGMEKVYEMGRQFRNEGMDIKHNPEFTTIEIYEAFTDYYGMMDLTENLFRYCAEAACGSTVVNYQGTDIDLGHFDRLTMIDAVKKYSGVDFNEIKTDAEAIAVAKEKGVEVDKTKETRGNIIALFFDQFVEENLVQPTFIMDYPVEISPLAKRKPDKPELTERFEVFITGREFGNAFSELNDPIDQKARFESQVALRAKGDDETEMMDEDFIKALEYGMPPTGGLGIGVDRLVMLLTDSYSIRDVLLFPTMKPLSD